jgi:two-component system nitrogen regulation response regulator NtrX
VKRFEEQALEALAAREWPGNVRELRNAVERLIILSSGERVTAADVRRLMGGSAPNELADLSSYETFEEFKESSERAFLKAKLEEKGWNVSETARALSMPRSNLYKKIEKYGLERE